jgi:hypothetical protein
MTHPAGRLIASALMLAGLVLASGAQAEAPRPARGPLGERELVLTNRSTRIINEIYVSASSANNWGNDRLEEATLAVGATTRIRLGRTRDCHFDIQIIYDDATREDQLAVDLCRSRDVAAAGVGAVPLPGFSRDPRTVTLANRAARPIRQVFITPAYSEQWGDDLLTAQIAEGETGAVTYRGGCASDLRVVFANRAAEERRGLDLCATPNLSIEPGWTTAEPVPSARAQPSLSSHSELEIVNRSGRKVAELFLYPDGAVEPAHDLLSGETLADGATIRRPFPAAGACRFRGRVVYTEAPAQSLDSLDLCDLRAITLTP